MLRVLGALALVGAVLVLSACSNASPEQLRTQATIAAAQSNGYAREARAMEVTAQAQAIERANMLATATALAVTPSATPAPTLTPLPTFTLTPEPTATALATPTPPAIVAAAVTQAPTVAPTLEPTPRARNIYDDWPILLLLVGALIAFVVIGWRLIDGKTVILPGRGNDNGQ